MTYGNDYENDNVIGAGQMLHENMTGERALGTNVCGQRDTACRSDSVCWGDRTCVEYGLNTLAQT